tara:strand:- start:2109 stop:2363 length:255 start_codon:yes stop_codon:yes gene_type:complete
LVCRRFTLWDKLEKPVSGYRFLGLKIKRYKILLTHQLKKLKGIEMKPRSIKLAVAVIITSAFMATSVKAENTNDTVSLGFGVDL